MGAVRVREDQAMMTGAEYKASLSDGRATYFDGRRIDDLVAEPVLGQTVDVVAQGYDRFYSPEPGAVSEYMTIPDSAAALQARMALHHDADLLTHVTYTGIMTLLTAAQRLGGARSGAPERIRDFVAQAQASDLRMTLCITDGKGDRSKHPGEQQDRDAYTRVVERRSDGIVIRGAKLHISGASFGHELMVIPTKAMRPGEEEYAVACVVPVNAPGVKIVNTTYAPRREDTRDFPFSGQAHMPEGFVIFDDVFVPESRIFLDGEVGAAAMFAHALGMWERLGALAGMADDADMLVGFAQLIAEANGLERVGHIREKISEMIIHATLVRAALDASVANCEVTDDGAAFPSELYVNAGKYQGAANYSLMLRHLHDIAGGSIVTAPSIADLEHPEVGDLVRKYLSTKQSVDGVYRARLFHAIRDLTADSYGGWRAVTNIQAGGGLYAQRIVTRKHYDLEGAKQLALHTAGIESGGGEQ